MGHFVKTVVIRAPVAQVWDFITHTSRLTEWAAEEVEAASADEMVVGTSWTEKMHIAGAPLETTWRIEQNEPLRKLVFAGISTGGGKARGQHTLAPHADGTQMTTEVEYSLPGSVIGRVLDRLLMERKTEGDITEMLRKAKERLESGGH
jgi:ligand-binding SRPBCC domain-containing protein